MTDWEARPLSEAQLMYGALDAVVCVQLFDEMLQRVVARELPTSVDLHATARQFARHLQTGKSTGDPTADANDGTMLLEVTAPTDVLWPHVRRASRCCPLSKEDDAAPEAASEKDNARQRIATLLLECSIYCTGDVPVALKNLQWAAPAVEKFADTEGLARVEGSPLSVCPAKSVAFFVDRQPVVVVALEGSRVHPQALATFCGVKRRAVRLASPEECTSIFGYVPGK
jgi:hypothetical protein